MSVAAAMRQARHRHPTAQNSQAAVRTLPAQNAANQTPTRTSPNQETPAKPDAGALAANENTNPSQSPANERSQPKDQTAAASPAQPAGSNSAPSNKDVASEKTKLHRPRRRRPRIRRSPSAPRTASSGLQALANNTKATGEQPTKPQSANASPAANPSTAKDATAAMKQPPANPQQPANSAAQMAKNETPKPAASQSKNPARAA